MCSIVLALSSRFPSSKFFVRDISMYLLRVSIRTDQDHTEEKGHSGLVHQVVIWFRKPLCLLRGIQSLQNPLFILMHNSNPKIDFRTNPHLLGTPQLMQGLLSMSRIFQNRPQDHQTRRMCLIVRNGGRLFFDITTKETTLSPSSNVKRAALTMSIPHRQQSRCKSRLPGRLGGALWSW